MNTDIVALIERQRHILEHNLEMIRHADSKTGFVVALDTALLGALAAVLPEPAKITLETVLLLVVGASCPLASLLMCWTATFPRVEGPESVIFFGRIAKMGMQAYCDKVRGLASEEYLDDLLRQTHRNAVIADEKFEHVRIAMRLLFFGTGLWLIAIALLYR